MSRVTERQRDAQRIDRLIAALEHEMGTGETDGDSSAGMDILVAGARVMVPLLERRAKLLGLDAEPGSAERESATETPVDRIKRLAVVPKAQGGSG